MELSVTEYAALFRALGDVNRLEILELLRAAGQEQCACVLLRRLGISQPTLSHHMKILCQCGLVTSRRAGRWTHYSLSPLAFRHGMELLSHLSDGACLPASVPLEVEA